MKAIITIGILLLTSSLFAQWAVPTQVRATNTIDALSDRGGLSRNDLLYGIPPTPGRIIGDTYLDDKWNRASILLFDSEKMIEGFPVKYDIKMDLIEVVAKNGIKIIDGKKVKSMVWLDSITNVPSYFINARAYTLEGAALNGFLQVVADGQLPLLKRTLITEKQPDYVPGLDVGSRDKKILKKESYYYSNKDQLTKIGSKKNLLTAFGDAAQDVESYIKINKLNLNKEEGLVKTFEYYNSKNSSIK
jgi:hypothetical protein